MPDRAQRTGLPSVFINGRFFAQPITGVQRYARETISCLDALLAGAGDDFANWTVLAPSGTTIPSFQKLSVVKRGRLSGHAWEQIELPWLSRDGLLCGFGFTGPAFKRRQIITVHDAAVLRVPEAYGRRFRAWYGTLVRFVATRAARVVTVSQFSAGEAEAWLGVRRARIPVTSEGWSHVRRLVADATILERHDLRGRPYLLAVGSPARHKNFALIPAALQVLGEAAPRCVVVGAADRAVFRDPSQSSIQSIGYVSDAELKALYEHATCFVIPSRYEGFGLPAIEAIACGCPVVASDIPALREVCGDAAVFFDPTVAASLASALRQVLGDSNLREGMRARGLARLPLFSWERTAEAYIEVVRDCLAAAEQRLPQPDLRPIGPRNGVSAK
jgi:glycosyltransferase involved in cell wall biosynthesis